MRLRVVSGRVMAAALGSKRMIADMRPHAAVLNASPYFRISCRRRQRLVDGLNGGRDSQCLRLFGPVQQLESPIVMFDQRSAVFDPVAIVDVHDAVAIGDVAAMDVSANMAVEPVVARTARHGVFEVFDKTARRGNVHLDGDGDRRIAQPHSLRSALPWRLMADTNRCITSPSLTNQRGAT